MDHGYIFYLHNVVDMVVQMYKRQKWREDIVVHYVTTYAVALRLCLLMYIIVKYIGRWLYVVITTKHKNGRCVVLVNEFYKKTHVDKQKTWAYNMFIRYGLLAQLVRALHSHCRGHKFESCTVHQFAFRLERFFYVRRKIRLFICIFILFRSLFL